MSLIANLIDFVSLSSGGAPDERPRRDMMLATSSMLRQLVNWAFLFGLVLYSWAPLPSFPIWGAWIVAFLVASTLALVDQAIIGAEWKFSACLPLRVLQMSPRIVYSLVIASFMAGLAELQIQSHGIADMLKRETSARNGPYLADRAALEARYVGENGLIAVQTALRDQFQAAVDAKTDPNAVNAAQATAAMTQSVQATSVTEAARIPDMERDQAATAAEVTRLAAEVAALKARLAREKDLAADELTPAKCKSWKTNPAACQGREFDRLTRAQRVTEAELTRKQNELATKEGELAALDAELQASHARFDAAQTTLGSLSKQRQQQGVEARSLAQLQTDLAKAEAELTRVTAEYPQALKDFDDRMRAAGKVFDTDYDFLDLAMGLAMLHADPVKGPAARSFSLGFATFLILIELAPVTVAVFFTPSSFRAIELRAAHAQAEAEAADAEQDRAQARFGRTMDAGDARQARKSQSAQTRAERKQETRLADLARKNALAAARAQAEAETYTASHPSRFDFIDEERRASLFETRRENTIREDVHAAFQNGAFQNDTTPPQADTDPTTDSNPNPIN